MAHKKHKFFVATSYSSQVDYETGEVLPQFRDFLEQQFSIIEQGGGEVFSAIRHDKYKINNTDPAAAFRVDMDKIKECDVFVAFLNQKVSAGVQAEIGMAVALGKRVILARPQDVKSEYFNDAIMRNGLAEEITLPLNQSVFRELMIRNAV
jgi:nucleoside 2-deoxyribosyltransferase